MKFKCGIEVSGITRVMINQDENKLWEKGSHGDLLWHLNNRPTVVKTQEEMTAWIKLMVINPKNLAWVHGDTLNIVRRDPTFRKVD